MLKIYLLRHGQTDYNLKMIVQGGGIDAPLNETGRSQGSNFHKAYGHLEFEGLYCTDLQRTYQTVQHFETERQQFVRMPEFRELNWGILEGVKGNPQIKSEFQRITSAWKAGDLDVKIEGGESPNEGWARVRLGLDKLIQAHPNGGKVLLCAHGRINRVLLAGWTGTGLDKMDQFPHTNTGLNIIQVDAQGRPTIEKLNDLSHLPA